MTLAEARSEIATVNAVLLDAELAIAVNPLVATRDGDKVRLTWPRAKEEGGILAKYKYSTISEYSKYFRDGHYTALLRDGALVQISYDFNGEELVGSRFCYYPCPLILAHDHDAGDWDAFSDILERELFSHIEDCEKSVADLEKESTGAEGLAYVRHSGLTLPQTRWA